MLLASNPVCYSEVTSLARPFRGLVLTLSGRCLRYRQTILAQLHHSFIGVTLFRFLSAYADA
jgi:hypothetical protein